MIELPTEGGARSFHSLDQICHTQLILFLRVLILTFCIVSKCMPHIIFPKMSSEMMLIFPDILYYQKKKKEKKKNSENCRINRS